MYIHKLLHDTFADTMPAATCTVTDMQQAAAQMLQQNAKRLQELLAYVTEQQKELLYAIAADRCVQRVTSADFVRRHHLKSASAVQSAVKRNSTRPTRFLTRYCESGLTGSCFSTWSTARLSVLLMLLTEMASDCLRRC